MNIYLVIAGTLALAGGLAHGILGHRWTAAAIDPSGVASSQFTGEQNRRFLVWFWHIGTVVLLSTGAILAAQGSGIVEFDQQILGYVSFLWLMITVVFLIVAAESPQQVTKMVPGLVGIPVNVLILLGLLS